MLLDTDDEQEIEEPKRCDTLPASVRILMCFLLIWQAAFHVSDASLAMLVIFFHHFFRILSSMEDSRLISTLAGIWPKSVASIYKLMGLEKEEFVQYVVCPKCHSIYDYNDCFTYTHDGKRVSKTCQHRPFPQHPRKSQRKPCGSSLLRLVKTKKGTLLRPWKIYCYRSLVSSLKQLLAKPNYINLCEQWRQRSSIGDLLGDVYDGQVWKDFQYFNGKPFLASPYSLVLSLNTDWFQPYTHTTYSVGVMYIVIQNLPRDIRYKPENVILCGIIPGPHEPQYTLNSYLSPLVEELLVLWDGFMMSLPSAGTVNVRAALLCIACDMPATRKVLGFSSFNSPHGCSKCQHFFPYMNEHSKHDFSDFDYKKWMPRTVENHHEFSIKFVEAKTKSERKKLVQEHGVRYCVLLRLPYFDPTRLHVIDPMHNLLLGTAKHVMNTWIDEGILTNNMLKKVQTRIEQIHSPVDVGRIPAKVASTFAGFKADQWRNWTLTYSPICLKGVIDGPHLQCWLLFVKACRLLCTRSITLQDIETSHSFLVQFCRTFVNLYGNAQATANLHMHIHLKNCLLDFGPVYSFCFFSFERYNGILGHYQTNNRIIEPQLMARFIREQQFRLLKAPDGFTDIEYLLQQMTQSHQDSQNITTVTAHQFLLLHSLKMGGDISSMNFQHFNNSIIQLLPPASEYILSQEYITHLQQLLGELHPGADFCQPLQLCRKYTSVCVSGEVFGSTLRRTDRNACIGAYWPTNPGNTLSSFRLENGLSFGFVQFYILYSVTFVNGNAGNYVFAFVK